MKLEWGVLTITQNKNVWDIEHYIMKKYISKVNTTDKSINMSTYCTCKYMFYYKQRTKT